MRVPDAIRKTVMFLGVDSPEGKKYSATAYLVSVPGGQGLLKIASTSHLTETVRYPVTFMVTARHVAEKLEGKKFYVRANKHNGEMAVIECASSTKWWYHPRERKHVDAAVTPFWPDELPDLDMEPVPLGMFTDEQIIREHNLGVGDEVFIAGLFTEIVETTKNIPIVRIGTVAMMPGEKIPYGKELIEAHLIESRSIGGLSGSPVFVRETMKVDLGWALKPGIDPSTVNDAYPGQSLEHKEIQATGRFYFLGSVIGHWDLPKNATTISSSEAVNMGIAPVVPAHKIKEVIFQDGIIEMMKKHTNEIIAENQKGAVFDSP